MKPDSTNSRSKAERLTPRSQWTVALAAVDEDCLYELSDRLSALYCARPATLPRAGLMLLQLRDGVAHERFFVGEIPVATARVVLTGPDSQEAEGGAILLDDDHRKASAVAVLDGVLAADWPGAELVADLLQLGAATVARTTAVRQAMLARTRVEFGLLNGAE